MSWDVKLTTMFDMTADSHLFRIREQMEKANYKLVGNVFVPKEIKLYCLRFLPNKGWGISTKYLDVYVAAPSEVAAVWEWEAHCRRHGPPPDGMLRDMTVHLVEELPSDFGSGVLVRTEEEPEQSEAETLLL